MRLIDADAFLENNKELADCDFIHPKYCDTLRDLVNNAPTVDVLEQIRDEIEQAKTIEIKTDDTAFKASADVVINPRYRNFTSGLDIALQIIDKYKGNKQ